MVCIMIFLNFFFFPFMAFETRSDYISQTELQLVFFLPQSPKFGIIGIGDNACLFLEHSYGYVSPLLVEEHMLYSLIVLLFNPNM